MNGFVTELTGKERILGAALRLFADRGFDRVTIRDIGAAAGLTNPALYRHYPGKEELGLDLYRRCYTRMLGALRTLEESHVDGLGKLVGYVPAVIALYETDPDAVHYVDEHQVRFWPQLRQEFDPRTLSGILAGWVRDGQRAGSVRTDLPVPALVALPLGLVTQWTAMRSAKLCTAVEADGLEELVRSALSPSMQGARG